MPDLAQQELACAIVHDARDIGAEEALDATHLSTGDRLWSTFPKRAITRH
jgi:hypothetical protein